LCDERRIKDVLSNLLTNAIKFMGEDKQKQVKIGCEENVGYYKIYVEDTGIGIQEEYREQIFKIFRRLNEVEAEGTGIGLAIVKKIVEQHKGKIWVESPIKDGRGSRFCFTIPTTGEVLVYQETQNDGLD
jgi:signal transduction histidine kinase